MELLGPSLFDLRRKKLLTQDDVPGVGVRALEALQWLHGRGFLHRDMKPEVGGRRWGKRAQGGLERRWHCFG